MSTVKKTARSFLCQTGTTRPTKCLSPGATRSKSSRRRRRLKTLFQRVSSKMSFYLRVWQACDIAEITKHLLIVGELTADCAACRELGIHYSQAPQGPE